MNELSYKECTVIFSATSETWTESLNTFSNQFNLIFTALYMPDNFQCCI